MNSGSTYARLSIGMPVFNDVHFITDSISSILAQEFGDFHLFISDNGSTDGTSQICQTFAEQDRRIKYIRQAENKGASWNFRHVFEMAAGEYFMWASSHDLLAPSFAAKCIAMLDHDPTVVLTYTKSRQIDSNGLFLPAYLKDDLDLRGMSRLQRARKTIRDQRVCNMIYGVFRRDVLSRLRLDRTCMGPDHVLFLDVALEGAIAQIPELLFFARKTREEPKVARERSAQQLERLTAKTDVQAVRWRYCHWYREFLTTILNRALPLQDKLFLVTYFTLSFVRRFSIPMLMDILGPSITGGIKQTLLLCGLKKRCRDS